MKLILLASCASALVVPPLAQRRRDLPVAKGFYDEDDEHDEAPRPWEVGGVRLERLVTMTGVGAAAYTTYILGSEALDATMVKQLGISRSESVAAFGPSPRCSGWSIRRSSRTSIRFTSIVRS